MPDNKRNLQIRQPGIEGYDVDDKNGWPTPLTDPSNPLRMKVTNGSNGTLSNFDPTSTSGQAGLSLPEGKSTVNTGNMETQGGHGNKLQTSQQNAGDHSQSEGEQGA